MLDNLIAINMDVTQKIIIDLVTEHRNHKAKRYHKLEQYYKGDHHILHRDLDDPTKPNNRIVNDYPGYIVDTIQGYFIGKPVAYSANNDSGKKLLEQLDSIYKDNNETDHNAEMAKYMGIDGESFELLYLDEEGQIRFVRIPNTEMIVVLKGDFQRSVQFAVRYYDVQDMSKGCKITYVDVYDDEMIRHYTLTNDTLSPISEDEHFFGKVPVVYYWNNDERIGDFEKVISPIDDYNLRISDNSNELEYFRNAYLKIKNMSGTSTEDIQEIKKTGAFVVEGDGDVSFVEKNINDSFTEHHLERLDKNIHKFSKVPNLSDESFAGNLSGVAIKYKLWPIEQIAANKERKFRSGLLRRIKLICNILNLKGGKYSWKDIEVNMFRNMPSNDSEAATMANQLKGVISDETLLGQLPFIDDPAKELERIKNQEEKLSDYSSLKIGSQNV